MRRPLVVGNWKMNTTLSDAIVLATSIKKAVADFDSVEVVLCPPYVWLATLTEILENAPKNLKLGAQNMWFADSGPVTGEISPPMIKPFVKYVILGHSERRFHFQESNALINDKVGAAIKHSITPLICVGELKKMQEEKRGRGRPSKIALRSDIVNQLLDALKGVSRENAEKIVLVYEPVWAISDGTKSSRNAATGAYANIVVSHLREVIGKKYGKNLAEEIRILYGGSVCQDNIKEFIYQPEIDGVLVGGASLSAKEFIAICRESAGKD